MILAGLFVHNCITTCLNFLRSEIEVVAKVPRSSVVSLVRYLSGVSGQQSQNLCFSKLRSCTTPSNLARYLFQKFARCGGQLIGDRALMPDPDWFGALITLPL